MSDFYSRSFIRDGKYIKEEIKATSYDLTLLKGNAVIVAVGGNGRFKFTLGGNEYISVFEGNIAQCNEEYFDYITVIFNIDIKKEWSNLYIRHESKEYWKEIK